MNCKSNNKVFEQLIHEMCFPAPRLAAIQENFSFMINMKFLLLSATGEGRVKLDYDGYEYDKT